MFIRLCQMNRASPEERAENVITLPPNQDRNDHFCLTFYDLDFKYPLMTHAIEAEGGSLVKSTVCPCREPGIWFSDPTQSSQLLVTSVPGDHGHWAYKWHTYMQALMHTHKRKTNNY